MASHDAMNREDGDADHVAVTQSDMTRATSAALQAAAAQSAAGQRPSPGGSAEMSAKASPQHHPESENTSAAAAGAGVPVDRLRSSRLLLVRETAAPHLRVMWCSLLPNPPLLFLVKRQLLR